MVKNVMFEVRSNNSVKKNKNTKKYLGYTFVSCTTATVHVLKRIVLSKLTAYVPGTVFFNEIAKKYRPPAAA